MNSPLIRYSVVAPIYNDGYLSAAFCEEIRAVFQQYLNKPEITEDVELIFVNDGSLDDSLELLRLVAGIHSFVKVINLSRNFGQHVALLCGYHHAAGQFIVRLNVDMQDPPREIPKLLDTLNSEDVDMVVGLQKERQSGWSDLITARFFFWVFNALIGGSIPKNTATLRIMNRRYVDAITQLNDKYPFLQGLESWIGFKVKYIPTEHMERHDKKSSYSFIKRLRLAINASISFSDRLLKASVFLGLGIGLLGFIGLALMLLRRVSYPGILPGYSSTLAAILFCSGVQILVIGLSGLYIGKILGHVQGRPLYLIRDKINI